MYVLCTVGVSVEDMKVMRAAQIFNQDLSINPTM